MECGEPAADPGGAAASGPCETTTKSPLDKPLAELTEEDIAQLTREDCRRFLKTKGMRRPSWNKGQAIQQVISLKALIEGRPGCGDCPAGGGFVRKPPPELESRTQFHDSPTEVQRDGVIDSGGSSIGQQTVTNDPSAYRRKDPITPAAAPPSSADDPEYRTGRSYLPRLPGSCFLFSRLVTPKCSNCTQKHLTNPTTIPPAPRGNVRRLTVPFSPRGPSLRRLPPLVPLEAPFRRSESRGPFAPRSNGPVAPFARVMPGEPSYEFSYGARAAVVSTAASGGPDDYSTRFVSRVTEEPPPAQMTVFYDGRVNVYNGVSVDQARAIMELAASPVCLDDPILPPTPRRSLPVFRLPGAGPSISTPPLARSFPIPEAGRAAHLTAEDMEERRVPRETEHAGPSRRASLQRYLDKRKDRFKGKRVLGEPNSSDIEMMYLNHKLNCATPTEIPNLNDASISALSELSQSLSRGTSQTREKNFIDLNDDGSGK